MSRRQVILLAGPVLALLLAPQPAARAEALPPADEWVPREAVIVLRVSKPKALLDLILRPELLEAIKKSPPFQAQAAKPGFREFQNVVKAVERRFEADWKTVLRRLVGGGATWAIGPNKANLFILDALDAEAPKKLHDILVQLIEGGAENRGQPSGIRSIKHGDATIWALGPNQAHVILGRRLMFANRPEVLKAALDLRARRGNKSVTSLPGYRQARKAAGADAAAFLYANAAVLKKLPPIANALAAEKNPLVALLAAPVTEALSRSKMAALALKIEGGPVRWRLTVDAVSDGTLTSSGAARFAVPAKAGGAAAPNLAVPRRIAAMSLHRDLRGFYGAKDDLFPERTSGLIFFENMMGIFFTGRDLTEEVLAEIHPDIRLVVAEQKYDPAIGTPAVQFPAFALVLRMKNPKRFSLVMEEAWQKAVGLINFTRGQQAQPGLIIDRPVYRGTKYTVACFTPPEETKDKTPVDARFNFRPALAMPGNYLILSSTDHLAEDIMDALSKKAPPLAKPPAGTHSLIEIDGAQLASILGANRENLIRNNMVDKGNARKQAETEINTLLSVVKHVSRVTLTFGADKGRSKISLQVQFSLPAQRGGSGGK